MSRRILWFAKSLARSLSTTKMSIDARLEAVPVVEIDGSGVFKYILIKVYGKEKADGSEHQKLIVRWGWSEAPKDKFGVENKFNRLFSSFYQRIWAMRMARWVKIIAIEYFFTSSAVFDERHALSKTSFETVETLKLKWIIRKTFSRETASRRFTSTLIKSFWRDSWEFLWLDLSHLARLHLSNRKLCQHRIVVFMTAQVTSAQVASDSHCSPCPSSIRKHKKRDIN